MPAPDHPITPVKKLLVANRGEIAIRVLRAASELGLRTVAVYTHEDRFALHRWKADEAYRLGPEGGAPVKGYLGVPEIVALCKEHGIDAVHPGYGFLSENADLARGCRENGIVFVGPDADLLRRFGDKTEAKKVADAAGVPTVPGTNQGLTNLDDVRRVAGQVGFPLMLKASFGGGGRGMRIVRTAEELPGKYDEASREATAAFGRGEVFLERYIERAKHIEVQVLGDTHGNLVHLWDRDCSVQRRHQKVVELAPSVSLSRGFRQRICQAAVSLTREAGYFNAGTVEFLVDVDAEEFFFIEVNPRVQVEHTVTEQVTGIDIVRSQILVAQGHDLHGDEVGIPEQGQIETRGVAMQCRITTEDPENNFIPDYGRLTSYRSAAGFGIRLDGGSAFTGAVITPFFDSLLVKLTCTGPTFEAAIARTDRALREFRVRGVKTNIPFLENLIDHPTFRAGAVTTRFIDETPDLFRFEPKRDRATKLLSYLGDVTVNERPDVAGKLDDRTLLTPTTPAVPASDATALPEGTRDRLRRDGPEAFARWTREQTRLLLTDTTFRDAHQSLLATRVRTHDLLRIAPAVARLAPHLWSVEMWGGATFDVSMRFLQESPWDRLRRLREAIPNVCFQMLLRASNAVGYTNYPDNVVAEFVRLSYENGMDVFRVFDSLNDAGNMKVAMDAVRQQEFAVCEAAVCYTGDVLADDPGKYTLDYYTDMARRLADMGAHVIAIKDMAGLLKPFAAAKLTEALRSAVDLPVHFHTHDTSGINAASILKATEAGIDVADAAVAAMSGTTSQPNLNSIVAALEHHDRATGLDFPLLEEINTYWEQARELYYPFEQNVKSGTADVYRHEMPGGQYTNLRVQAASLGLADRWPEIAAAYASVNQLFGDIVKVTPSSKVVGDMALFMVTNDVSADDVLAGRVSGFPRSVVDAMAGLIGTPPGGWPAEVRDVILKSASREPIDGRPGATLPPADFDATRHSLAEDRKIDVDKVTDEDVITALLYPAVFTDYLAHVERFGDTSVLDTPTFFAGMTPEQELSVEIEPGKTLIVKFLAQGEPRPDGTRVGYFELNGQPREVVIDDRAREATVRKAPKADPADANHVGAPMPGKVNAVAVKAGDEVAEGDKLLSIEAMKMETAVYAPRAASIAAVNVEPGLTVSAGDLLVELE